MTNPSGKEGKGFIDLTAEIVSAYVGNNTTPASELPEEFLNWMTGVAEEEDYKPALTFYGLYNIHEERGFAGW